MVEGRLLVHGLLRGLGREHLVLELAAPEVGPRARHRERRHLEPSQGTAQQDGVLRVIALIDPDQTPTEPSKDLEQPLKVWNTSRNLEETS